MKLPSRIFSRHSISRSRSAVAAFLVFGTCLCAQTTISNTTYNSGQTVTVYDPTSIAATTNVTVSSGATVTFSTPGQINLSPGIFTAATGSTFTAFIYGQVGTLQQTSVTGSSITFTWAGTAGSFSILQYNIYRNGVLIGETNPTTLTFTDTNVSPNTGYTYTISAVDSKGNLATGSIGIDTPGPSGSLNGYQVVLLSPGGQFYGVATNWSLAAVTPH